MNTPARLFVNVGRSRMETRFAVDDLGQHVVMRIQNILIALHAIQIRQFRNGCKNRHVPFQKALRHVQGTYSFPSSASEYAYLKIDFSGSRSGQCRHRNNWKNGQFSRIMSFGFEGVQPPLARRS